MPIMDYAWDDEKNTKNVSKHGISFARMLHFEWASALIIEDERRDYAERRFAAYGWIEGRLFICVYTLRSGVRRVISLRKANKREEAFYEKAHKAFD